MLNKVKKFWVELDHTIEVNQRELVLGATVCALAGIVAGILLSPKKTTTIGSNNGSNNTGNSAIAPGKPLDSDCPDEGKEDEECVPF